MNLSLFIPEIILACFAVLVILLDLVIKQKSVLAWVSVAGLIASGWFSVIMWGGNYPAGFNNMIAADNFALFFKLLFLSIAMLVIMASNKYVLKFARFQGEYYALLLLATLGVILMVASTDLIVIYVALELASISLYVLVSLLKDKKSTESSIKYLLVGATASGVLLYGMALVFGFTGTTQLGEIAKAISATSGQSLLENPGLFMGISLMISGFGFKITAVPFQMWVPDIYEGAPTTVAAYLSVASKASGFAVVLRVFHTAFGSPEWLTQNWGLVFAALAVLTMIIGNVLAIPQTNIKRMMGYSSIAQAGYLMVGLAALGMAAPGSILGQSGIIFFLTSYTLTNLGVFIAIILITSNTNSDLIADFAGMGKRSPWLALALTLCLISLIGMPPAAGFMAKFYIFSAAAKSGLVWLVIIAVINSVISAYYYLRIVNVMWFAKPASEERVASGIAPRLALLLCCLGVLALGIVPGIALNIAELSSRMIIF